MNSALRIKKIREYRNIKQTDMADRMHIEQSTYSNIESGITKFTTERLEQIAKILEVPVEAIWESDNPVFNLHNNDTWNGQVNGYIEHLHQENMEIYEKSFEMLKAELEVFKAQNAALLKALEKLIDKG